MSTSSSEAGEYYEDPATQIDHEFDTTGFNGWGTPAGQVIFTTKSAEASAVEEEWPSLEEPRGAVMSRSEPIGVNESEEDDEIYKGEIENEEESEDSDSDSDEVASEKRKAETLAAEKKRRLEEAKKALEKTQSEREKHDAEEAEQKRLEEEAKARKELLEKQEAQKKVDEERRKAEEAANQRKQQEKRTTVPPIPKESMPDFNRRRAETGKEENPVEGFVTPKEADVVLAKHNNTPNQIAKVSRDPKTLNRLRAALEEFHNYAKKPAASRDSSFQNEFFNAKSKDITVESVARLRNVIDSMKKLQIGGDEQDSDRLLYELDDEAVAPLEVLLKNISHALCAYVTSQVHVSSERRSGLAKILIAQVTKHADEHNIARTTQILSYTIACMLLSEAAALKTAALLSSDEKKQVFISLRQKIVDDVSNFIKATNAFIPSEAETKKILLQITNASALLEKAEQTAIGNTSKQTQQSRALNLSVLLRQFVRYNPAIPYVGTDNGGALALLVYQSNLLVPELIMYPEALYDVLAGMLDGLKGTFNVIDKPADRKKVIDLWNEIKESLTEQTNYLASSSKTSGPAKTTQPKPTLIDAKRIASQPAKPVQEEKFLRRFEDSDEED